MFWVLGIICPEMKTVGKIGTGQDLSSFGCESDADGFFGMAMRLS